jgi:hypothetical protein
MPLVDQDARRIRPPQGVGISNREKLFREVLQRIGGVFAHALAAGRPATGKRFIPPYVIFVTMRERASR